MADKHLTVCCTVGGQRREASVPLTGSIAQLRDSVVACFPPLKTVVCSERAASAAKLSSSHPLLTLASLQEFLLTDCTKDVHTDADAQLLFAGQKLWAVNPSKGLAAAPATVRCSFEHA